MSSRPRDDAVAVAAALIEREGRLLICQRRADDSHPLKWEFPGGKLEPGEDAPEALARELDEELSIRAVIGAEIRRYRYGYSGRRPFELIFLRVASFEGEPRNNVFQEIRWAAREDLAGYDFLEGDRAFVRALVRGDF